MATEETEDPYIWLEDVTGEKALAWVEEQDAESTGELAGTPEFDELQARILSILDSDDKIPWLAKRADHYYNFWQDGDHEKGLWRRTSLEEYRKGEPTWETVLDLDALAAAEEENWVWHGARCLEPEYRRCLVSLSRGGADADVTREFDTVDKTFVDGGFFLPEAKAEAAWIDADTLFVMTDFGEGTLTESGYPRQVKIWKRGTPLEEAVLVFEGEETDVAVGAYKDHTEGFEREFVYRAVTFWTQELYFRNGGELVKIDVPIDANAWTHREYLYVELRSDWTIGEDTFVAGSLLATPFDAFLAGGSTFQAVFTPTERTALSGVTATRNFIVLNVLDNVRSRLYLVRPDSGSFASTPIEGLTEFGELGVSAVDAEHSDEVWLTITDFLTPTTLSLYTLGGDVPPEQLKSLPAFFDVAGLEISQHEATSKDGTRVPYFQVSKGSIKKNGKNPTLLYGYGGFEISLTPSYSATTGAAWLEQGGVYVLANIRGGGEFGPRWHQAALKEHRHRAYEDFAAVAEDLVARKITKPKHLGAMGGSNGGLLMGNMLTEYPDHFGAIVCRVPLLDMKRFHTLLAGASWMGEYGDPDVPEEWEFIKTFSPYHNVKAGGDYPRILFTTSTRDDRVHPAHARKMVARMKEQGHDVLYWENIEGGHGGAANNSQRALMYALAWRFLWQELE